VKFILSIPVVLLFVLSDQVMAGPAAKIAIDNLLTENLDSVCARFPSLPDKTCKELVTASVNSYMGIDVDMDALKDAIKADIKKPELLNSLLLKSFGDKIPLGLEFKMLDSKQGDNVLGLAYLFDYNLLQQDRREQGNWSTRTKLAFTASGTVTNDSNNNPRNFLDTKFNYSKAYTTQIPVQSMVFATKLTDAASEAAIACTGTDAAKTDACIKAKQKAFALLDSTSDFLRAFQRYEAGLDAGVESDQTFNISQSKFGAFINGQYENWGTNTLIGRLGITPSFRFAIDKVDPNSETPRALAGDNSTFYRYSTEISLWMPAGTYLGKKLVFTLNYRNYSEISPSAVVENAGLASYNLTTISISMPTGLFASYSSGDLPLDQISDDVIELGWKTYF